MRANIEFGGAGVEADPGKSDITFAEGGCHFFKGSGKQMVLETAEKYFENILHVLKECSVLCCSLCIWMVQVLSRRVG